MNHRATSGNMVESLDSAARIVYTCSARQPHKNALARCTTTVQGLTNYLRRRDTMATPNCNGKRNDSATPHLYEDHQKIVTLPAMARHVSRATLLRLITHLQADRPASARVHSANVGDDGDGAR